MVVRVRCQCRGRLEPVEVAAERFDGVEFADDGQVGFVRRRLSGMRECGVYSRLGSAGGAAGRGRSGGKWKLGLGIVVDRPVRAPTINKSRLRQMVKRTTYTVTDARGLSSATLVSLGPLSSLPREV